MSMNCVKCGRNKRTGFDLLCDDCRVVDARERQEREVRNRMQNIGDVVKKELPKDWGFFVLAFKFGDTDVKAQYVSNGRREDTIKSMREFIARNPLPKPENN